MDKEYISRSSPYFKNRIQELQNFFIELSSGNFDIRIAYSEQHGALEPLVVTVNMFVEEIAHLFQQQDLSLLAAHNSLTSYTSFILDDGFRIWGMCPKTAHALSLDLRTIKGAPFNTVLTEDSQKNWEHIKKVLGREENIEDAVKLAFILPNGFTRPAYCRLSALQQGHKKLWAVMVLARKPEKNSPATTKNRKKKHVNLHFTDIEILTKIKRNILQSPEKNIPNLNILAREAGINEHKLKHGFKQLFGITVFQLQRRERLKRAKTLVEYTNQPLKLIARNVGYSLAHFSYTFKKEFGKPPGEFRKK